MLIGKFVKSKAGHDKDMIYIVLMESDKEYFLVDGIHRPYENPKKKNKKHVQPITTYFDETICKQLENHKQLTNEAIKRAIKLAPAFKESKEEMHVKNRCD